MLHTIYNVESIDRCSNCVLPRSVPYLFAPRSDTCNVCHLARSRAGEKESSGAADSLDVEIESIRALGHGRSFDCLIGLSGGRDSTYLAYLLVKKHRLRCLAAYYRTVFTPDTTDQNVRNTARQLGISLVEIRNIPWMLHRRIARKFCLLWAKSPLPEIANLCCAPCKFVNRELLRIANRHGIRSLVLGDNKFEEIQFLPSFLPGDLETHAHSWTNQCRKLVHLVGKGLRLVAKCPSVLPQLPLCIKASLLYLTPYSAYLRLRYPQVRRLAYFFCAPWNEQEVVGTIQSELGWRLPPDCTGSWKTDCEFAELKNYMFCRMYGATYADGMLSNLIRAGQLSRDEAMSQIRDNPQFSRDRMRRVLETLELSKEFVEVGLRTETGSRQPE